MGCGPGRILGAGIIERLQSLGHVVELCEVDPRPDFPAEIDTAFAVMGGVAEAVRAARAEGCFPFVLAGNCNTTVGTVGGLSPRRVGVIWFDGHADFETPETTTSGFIDGMGMSILTGHCWQAMVAARIPGFTPLPGTDAILAGASDVEPWELALLEETGVVYLSDEVLNGSSGFARLAQAAEDLSQRVDGLHLHIDLDVHDPRLARANHFRPPGGLAPDRLQELVGLIVDRVPLLSAAITAYDPEVDTDAATLASCLALVETVAARATAEIVPS